MNSNTDSILFENILVFAETSNTIKEINRDRVEKMTHYFLTYGWDLKIIPSKRGKMKFYFYGTNSNLIRSNIELTKDFFKSITSDAGKLTHIEEFLAKEEVECCNSLFDYNVLNRYMDAFAILFRNYFKKDLMPSIKLNKKTNLEILQFDPYSICLNGITLRITVPSTIEDNFEMDIRSIFSGGLEHISYFDPLLDSKKRITRKKNLNSKTTEFTIILRFSPKDRYSLRLSKSVDVIPDLGLYKGVNKIAMDMFRYIRIHEYERAEERLHYEETARINDIKTIRKINILRKLLTKYMHYQALVNVLNKTPDDKEILINKLNKKISSLINQLNKADFFNMCIISQRDFRVFELNIATLKNKIEHCKEKEAGIHNDCSTEGS